MQSKPGPRDEFPSEDEYWTESSVQDSDDAEAVHATAARTRSAVLQTPVGSSKSSSASGSRRMLNVHPQNSEPVPLDNQLPGVPVRVVSSPRNHSSYLESGKGGTSRSIPPGSPRKAVRHKQAIIEVKTDSEDDIDITTPYTVSVRLPSSKGSSAVISPALKAKGTPKKTAALARASTMPVVASHASQSRLASPPLERSISAADLLSPLSSMALNELPTPSPVQLSSSGFAVIAHDATKQQLMDNYGLSWGTQYEIARGITNGWWAWEDVTGPKMSELKDTNQRSAPKVADVMGRPEYAAGYNYPLWAELDREQAAIIENNSRGLGLQGEWMGESKWYGGRIQQIVHLVKVSNNDKEKSVRYELKLGRMQMGRSHRFARFLGSRRILQIKLPKDYSTDWALMKKYFLQKFVLCGRVYVPFSVKDGKLYSMEINEDYERAVQVGEGDHYRLSLDEFVRWHNPMDLNAKQKVSKWVSRFDLGLSTSVPAIKFEPENITRIGDEYAPFEGNDAPAHAIFTDGCGFMNGSALMAIGRQLGYSERPTAVQGRIFGSKGVWILHPDDRLPDAPPRIWIRASQQKIKLLDTLNEATLRQVHPAHVIFDLLAPSRVSIPARLSRLTIINLAHNKIPKQVLVSLMESGLRAEVAALTQWSGPAAMPLLWSAVNKVSGVSSLRLQRYAAGVQRALGLVRRENDPDDDESESEEDPTTSPDCLIDGKPPSIGETVLEKLQSGFSPLEDHTLFEDIKQVVKNTIESSVKDYHIVVQQSAEAYIVPDPLGVLEEGQIHFKSSQNLEDPLESLHPNNITGEVLIYRNPARVPSDVQKVIAVSHPALAEYVDVIVLPIKGARSLASLLAGGDVDGDVAVCVWDQTLVQSFVQPPITEEPPSFLDRNFEPMEKVLQVAAVLQTIKDLDPMEADVSLRSQLLIGLSDTKVGIYSLYHEKSIYTLGYDHDSSIRTAFMFTTILDSRKTGLLVRDEIFRADRKSFSFAVPSCLAGSSTKENQHNRSKTKRYVTEPFILDELLEAGGLIGDDLLREYDSLGKTLRTGASDRHLRQPYEDVTASSSILKEEVQSVEAFVNEIYQKWGSIWSSRDKARGRDKDSERKRVKEVAACFKQDPTGCETLRLLGRLDAIKASYAYSLSPKFAFNCSFQTLCSIKADASGSVAFSRQFSETMTIPASAVRILSQRLSGPQDTYF